MRLEINHKKKKIKEHKHVAAKQYATKQPLDHGRNQRGNEKTARDKWKQKYNDPKLIGCIKSSSKRAVYSNIILPQETRKISNKQLNFTLKTTSERRTNRT